MNRSCEDISKAAILIIWREKNLGLAKKLCSNFDPVDGVSWVYHATGRNCNTASEAKTIKRAIKQHLATTDGNSLCSTECLDLTKSATWSGYLLIGPTNNFDSTMYCGPILPVESCASRREKRHINLPLISFCDGT